MISSASTAKLGINIYPSIPGARYVNCFEAALLPSIILEHGYAIASDGETTTSALLVWSRAHGDAECVATSDSARILTATPDAFRKVYVALRGLCVGTALKVTSTI
ncbi:hypothetical protein Tco_0323666 [Tanacetum coccineum]